MSYVDGFVLPLSKDNVEEYRKQAEFAGKIFIELGALEFHECVLEDSKSDFGMAFPHLADAGENETVMFSYIVYKSREHRDEVNRKFMGDARMKDMDPAKMPFDCSRMAYGGFKEIVTL